MPNPLLKFGPLALALCLTPFTRADVKLPAVFSDHMVVQRDKPIAVWGWAEDGEKVTVQLGGDQISTEAKGGKWKVLLSKMKAGGPHKLKVQGKNEVEFNDILIGEVW